MVKDKFITHSFPDVLCWIEKIFTGELNPRMWLPLLDTRDRIFYVNFNSSLA